MVSDSGVSLLTCLIARKIAVFPLYEEGRPTTSIYYFGALSLHTTLRPNISFPPASTWFVTNPSWRVPYFPAGYALGRLDSNQFVKPSFAWRTHIESIAEVLMSNEEC